MLIAVNTRWLIKNKLEGMGWFTHHLMSRIVKQHPEVDFLFLFDRPFDQEFIYGPNVKGIVVQPPARHPFLWFIWNEIAVRATLAKHKPDLYFSTDGFIPQRTKVKTLNTIHDLNTVHFPEFTPGLAGKHFRHYFLKGAQKANRLVTVSEFSKKDIVKTYGILPEKIDVVHNAVSGFTPKNAQTKQAFKNKFTQGEDYFVFVGALNPRKNLQRIFPAFDLLKSETKLLVVGSKMYWDKSIEAAYNAMKNKDKVVFTGRLNGEELNLAYAAATALVFPSVYEGFGIPILEALQSGTAVITANNSSLPEVGGEAAIYVNAESTSEIQSALERLESDEHLRNHLITKGEKQLKKFNWDTSAEKLWQSMLKTINS